MIKSMTMRIVLNIVISIGCMNVSLMSSPSFTVTGDDKIIIRVWVEKLFGDALFTEGPAYGPDGMVYFTDITITFMFDMKAGRIWKYNPSTKTTSLFRSPSGMANGLFFDTEGHLYAAEGADFGGRESDENEHSDRVGHH